MSEKNSPLLPFLDKAWRLDLLLFICSFSIYLVYFSHVFSHINSIMAGITGDALKNYFTFAYHIKNDPGLLHFSGMNFPFGEHVVFTDCQPLLTFILKALPFTHDYLIGILHSLLFLSYIITPLILNRIFLRLGLDKLSSFFISLAITLLSPQFAKIAGGHHALAYGCVIPFAILLLLKYTEHSSTKNLLKLFFYNSLLFLLHPYMGFSTSIFTFFALFSYSLIKFEKKSFLKNMFKSGVAGVLPLLFFKLFMKLSDQHPNRTVEPHGNKTLIENTDSLLAPDFGPFRSILESIFSHKTNHLEGHSYIGAFMIVLTLVFILVLPFYKRLYFKKEIVAITVSACALLFISFGLHLSLLEFFHVNSPSLNQFRATCRFAWFFYYTFPIFIIPSLYHLFKTFSFTANKKTIFQILAFLFFCSNLWEANSYFKKDDANFWKFRNLLSEKFLNAEEKKIIKHLHDSQTQAILPLPMFALGSEMYDRIGADLSMIPSMLYSYHTGIPIIGGAMSRTSISETEEYIELLNSYKKKNVGIERLNSNPILVIKTKDPLLCDEDRLLTSVNMFYKNDSLEFGETTQSQLAHRKLDSRRVFVNKKIEADSTGIVFIPYDHRKPFVTSRMQDYENIYTLDSNKFKTGNYILSFHYHYTEKIYTSMDLTLIVTQTNHKESAWKYFQRISILSGFYNGFAVMEYKIQLEKGSRYEFLLKGLSDKEYKISHFMIRPEFTSVISTQKNDSLFNNFPD
ncbi:hypothetical protein CNR22_07460 [Sphingobacteriaceae bacterium]|nr:hypothetical protein CNR22_07460 [Sphingobacteriaceae bacterium]